MKSYRVNEIFYSLQGEGAHTGRPAAFVRFSGCNLRCPFCDTDFHSFTTMSGDEILRQLLDYPTRYVVLTGGEPALQVDDDLVNLLHQAGYTIAIETNGTHPLPDGIDWVTVSPKEESTVVLTHADELKVVYIGQKVEHYTQTIDAPQHFLQPCSQERDGVLTDNREEVVDYCLQHPHWRLSLQMHKILNIR